MNDERESRRLETELMIRRAIRRAGFQTGDPIDFFNSIDILYRRPSVNQVIAEEVPQIRGGYPYFFERHLMDLNGVDERLHRLYPGRYDRAAWSFKVKLRHIRYFLIDQPDEKEQLEETVDDLRKLLDGKLDEII